MKTNPYIIDYYNNYDEDSRLSPRHGTVEFLTTMRYIEKYIKPGSRVLEIGAGTGRYSHALARLGYTVDAVELVPHNIEVFCSPYAAGRTYNNYPGQCAGLISLFGQPIRHHTAVRALIPSIHKKDKRQALGEAIRVTKQGGIIFAAYVISDGCLLDEGFNRGNINAAEYIKTACWTPKHSLPNPSPKICLNLCVKKTSTI